MGDRRQCSVKSLTITSDQLTAGAITLNGALTATLGGSSSITGVIANGQVRRTLLRRQGTNLECFEHLYWYDAVSAGDFRMVDY